MYIRYKYKITKKSKYMSVYIGYIHVNKDDNINKKQSTHEAWPNRQNKSAEYLATSKHISNCVVK